MTFAPDSCKCHTERRSDIDVPLIITVTIADYVHSEFTVKKGLSAAGGRLLILMVI